MPPHRGTGIKLCPPYTVTQVGGPRPLNKADFSLSAALSWAISVDSSGTLGTPGRGRTLAAAPLGCGSALLPACGLAPDVLEGLQELGGDSSQGP